MQPETVNLKILLLRASMTQQEIASRLGQSKAMVSHVVNGRRRKGPQAREIAKYIARTLSRKLKEKYTVGSLFGAAS